MTLDQAKRFKLPRGFRHAGRALGDIAADDWEYFAQLRTMPTLFGPLKEALAILSAEMGLAKKEDPNQSALNLRTP